MRKPKQVKLDQDTMVSDALDLFIEIVERVASGLSRSRTSGPITKAGRAEMAKALAQFDSEMVRLASVVGDSPVRLKRLKQCRLHIRKMRRDLGLPEDDRGEMQ